MSMNSSDDETRVGSENDVPSDGFIELIPNTHDISHAGKHIPSLTDLTSNLEASIKAVWSRRHGSRYTKVCVLLLRWASDDLGVVTDINDLRHVLGDIYHYQVESYEIPDERPDTSLKRRILQFLEHDGMETLLIVYYAGHASKSVDMNTATWHANRIPKSPALAYRGVQSMLEEAYADVLLLYDCCHSAATKTSPPCGGYKGVTEVISACGYETIAPPVCEHSFSKALIQILAAASQGPPFSVGELHMRILNRLMCWTPCLAQGEDGKFIPKPDGKLAYERQPRRTPIYSIICETEPRRSITLAPLATAGVSRPTTSIPNNINTPLGGVRALSHTINPTESLLGKRKRLDVEERCSQVLMAIRLEKDGFDQRAWLDWLRLAPPECNDIKIDSRYDSFSTLLLVRMPIAVWDLLPDNVAFSFVGFVTSENQALTDMSSLDHFSLDCYPPQLPFWSPSISDFHDVPENLGTLSNIDSSTQSYADSDWSYAPSAARCSDTSYESLRFIGRSSMDMDNTFRDHPLYRSVEPQADGLYHCPWEGEASCLHKPDKLKCNYDKFVESHLKPYRCKVLTCENLSFSSTAALLRHEREAHSMHGHGDKPFLCTYESCERGRLGNGFPRQWNLRDHMKRVHNVTVPK